ncbi:uncharacterized protein METZ01_LOCUS294223, partial [marine metagenome]
QRFAPARPNNPILSQCGGFGGPCSIRRNQIEV